MIRTARSLAAPALAAALLLAGCATARRSCPPPAPPVPRAAYVPASWADLPGWSRDEMKDAWPAFLASCGAVGRRAQWTAPCEAAQDAKPATSPDVRAFF